MKILIVTFTFPPEANGVSHVADAHAKGFLSKGHRVSVATSFNPERNIGQLRKEGMEIFQFNVKGSGNIRVGYSGDIKSYQKFLADCDADIILFHCWQAWSTNLAIPMFPFIKSKKILISHGVSANSILSIKNIFNWLCWRPYIWKMPQILRSFDHVVFLCNRQDKDRFYDFYLANKLGFKRYSIIPNGTYEINDRHLDNFKDKFKIVTKRMLLSVSNYEPIKNQRFILKAFAKSRIIDATLVFIGGKKNKYSAALEKIAQKMGIKEKVLLLEKLSKDEITSAYLSADLFLFSSLSEAQPLVVLDAMRAGVPFISTNVGCVADFPGGYIVKSESEMAMKIRELIENDVLRSRLGEEGKEACRKIYDWGLVIEKYEKLFEELLKNA